jgi:hypothetical protein
MVNRSAFRTIAAVALFWVASAFPVLAQTAPNWTYGYVPTTAQWNAIFASKQDYLGAPPLLTTGGTMTGKITTEASVAINAGINLPAGVAPTSPLDGDMWSTTAGLFVRINGTTIGPLGGATSASFAATGPLSVSFPAGVTTYACSTCAVTTNPLSQFAATTSAQLLGVLSDETGTGLAVFNTNANLVTPTIGVATATSINKVTITAPATSATLTIANGKTLTVSNSLTFTGTDATSFAFPGTSDTVVTLGATQTLTAKTLTATSNVLGGVTMTLGSDATGDIYYRNSSGFLTRLGVGSNTNVLTLSAGLPSWQAGSSAASITVGTTTVNTGTTLNFLYNNAGVLANTPLVAGTGISLGGTANATITNIGVSKIKVSQVTGSGTYTPTAGMIYVQVECVAAGGGGGGIATNTTSGAAGSGGGGAYSRSILSAATVGASKTYAAGTGGSGAAAGNNNGLTGGDCTFNSTTVVAKGGVGGAGTAAPNQSSGGPGGLASGGTGDVKFNGGGGSAGGGSNTATTNWISGVGGSSFFGGGAAGNPGGTGLLATVCGGGGSGGAGNNAGNLGGGAGADGCLVFTEFLNQ